MRRGDKLMLIPFAIVVILLAGSIIELFSFRFRQGDIYPPYSSLRADPLGTKALYEIMERMSGFDVVRNLERFDKLDGSRDSSVVYIGLNADQDAREPTEIIHQLGSIAISGSRVVVGFLPVLSRKAFDPYFAISPPPPTAGKVPPPAGARGNPLYDWESWRELMLKWDVRMEFMHPKIDRVSDEIVPFEADRTEEFANRGLPESLTIQTGIYFLPADSSDWKIVYRIEDRPVILERKYGEGTIVLLAEAFPLSNEALHTARQPALLAWIFDSTNKIIFDETHFGIEERPGLMNLARKYGLQAAIASLGLLAILFIWHSVVPVVPRYTEEEEVEQIARQQSRDSFSGMVNLLRRSIRPQNLMEVCLAQWKRTLRGARPGMLTRIQQADAAARLSQDAGRMRAAPAESYRDIFEILNRRGGNQ